MRLYCAGLKAIELVQNLKGPININLLYQQTKRRKNMMRSYTPSFPEYITCYTALLNLGEYYIGL